MKLWLRRLLAWRLGKLAKGTFAMTAGLGLRTVAQGVVFLIVARVLGVELYGAYAAVLALAMAVGVFGGVGVPMIMLRDTARDPAVFAESWGRTLAALLVTVPILFATYLLLAWVILPNRIGWVATICIGAAEILSAPLTLAAVRAYQGHERIGRAARMVLAPILPRLAVALILPLALLLPASARLSVWAAAYLLAAAVSTSYALWLLRHDFGLGVELSWHGLARAAREGWPFSVGGAAQKVYIDIDKIMLARLATWEVAGAYSAAYRVVDMARVPLMSFFSAASSRFFRAGQGGMSSAARYALRVLPLPLVYALVVGGYSGSAALVVMVAARGSAAIPYAAGSDWIRSAKGIGTHFDFGCNHQCVDKPLGDSPLGLARCGWGNICGRSGNGGHSPDDALEC
ncbi:MAG: oligosaccharide flippase family protein [Acidihalobacter sp.]